MTMSLLTYKATFSGHLHLVEATSSRGLEQLHFLRTPTRHVFWLATTAADWLCLNIKTLRLICNNKNYTAEEMKKTTALKMLLTNLSRYPESLN